MMKWLVLSKRYERKLITKEEYYKEKIKLLGKLDMRLQYFRDLNSQIQEYEITSEESLRQLTEKIDRDLDEVKLILESLSTIEKQLAEIEQSQKVVVLALNECLVYTNTLENFVNSYIETGRSEDANIKISSSNYFDIKDIEKSENDDSNKKLPGLINFD